MTIRRVEIHVTAEDQEAKTELRDLKTELNDIARPRRIRLAIDFGDQMKLDKLKVTLDELGTKVARPTVEVQGVASSLLAVMALNRELDRLNGRKVSAGVGNAASTAALVRALNGRNGIQNVNVVHPLYERLATIRDLLPHSFGSNLFHTFQLHRLRDVFSAEKGLGAFLKNFHSGGGGGGEIANLASGAGGAASGGGGFLGALTSALPTQARGALIGGGVALAAAMLPGLLGLGVGGLVGAGGLYGAYKLDPKAFARVKKNLSAAFVNALTSKPQGIESGFGQTGKMGPFGTGGESFLQGIKALLRQFDGFIKTISPELGGMFRASLPILNMFLKSFETLVRLVMPSFLILMNAIKPELPMFQAGFKLLAQGIADFLKNLGPGMKASGIIFKAVMETIKGVLIGASYAIVGFEKFLVWLGEKIKARAHDWRNEWDIFRHETAVIFDGVRHDLAHIWDSIWNDTAGRIIRGWHDVETFTNNGRHEISNIFDGIRHDIAHWWDLAWNDTIGAAIRFGHTVETKVDSLRSSIANIVKKLPGELLTLGKQALSDLWNGMKSVAPNIFSWAKSFIGNNSFGLIGIIHKALGINSPSRVMMGIGRSIMLGLEQGMKQRIPHVQAITGHIGGSVASWIRAAMAGAHAPSSWFPALERLVSLESSGNPRAVNSQAVDGQHATGMWQMLPSTYASYAWGLPSGDLFNPVVEGIAALRYIMSNYGSPFNIPGLMSGNYHGYWGGGWVNEPVVGFGMNSGAAYSFAEHGREYVSPGGSGPGVTVNIFAHPSNNPDEIYREVWKGLRHLKQHNGGQPLGLA